ncbi:uncharacterized protein LOC131695773 [Topomyia yanbarensis]|uniref:uncharacterized protein LOC131695773 n=1 Tax=Topomyia yanbarensis TaxID=2498891 RepID=UPI00273B6D90|nr:uncharacterized protein LOC131695773 [Topomyia yanbarensis]
MAEEQQINLLVSRRTTMLEALGRAEAFLRDFNAQRDGQQVPLRLEYLNRMWTSLEEVQAQLEDGDVEGRAEHAAIRADFEPRLFSIKAAFISYSPPLSVNAGNPQPLHATSTLSGIKLPTISLPEFDGDYKQWLTFHDTFLALIHNNADVPPIQKFHYLRAAVKGEAAQLIESIAICSANYSLAWQALEGRYSNEYLLKKRHLQALFDIPRMKKESAATLHGLVDEFERHTKILHHLGEPTDAWSTILEHLLCTRLHDDSLKAWEDHASVTENPNFACLIDFLQRRTRVLESISVNHHQSTSTTNTNDGASASHFRRQSQFRLSSCASTANYSFRCPICSQQHSLARCGKFNSMSVNDRQQLVNTKRLCHNCLRGDHIVRQCPCDLNCKKCNQRHHTLLHTSQSAGPKKVSNDAVSRSTSFVDSADRATSSSSPVVSEQTMVAAVEDDSIVETSVSLQHPRENVFLLTVIVNIVDAYGQHHPARALLDSASQPNLITDRMARILRLKKHPVNVTVQGAGQLSKVIHESIYAQVSSRKEHFSCGVNFLVMDKLTANLPAQNVSITDWRIPKDLFLADPTFNKSQPIDVVLGAKHFYSFFPNAARIQLHGNLPLLVDSVFGWIVAGSADLVSPKINPSSNSSSLVCVSMVSLEETLERFWKIEELTTKDNYSVEERRCEKLYQSTVSRNPDGRYIVRLPRKPDFDDMLGESKANALRRFEYLERRLERNSELKVEYHRFMQEYIDLGHMQPSELTETKGAKSFYLPHHPVIKEASTTTKVRVVFDGSAKTSTGFSLNDALCVGPVVQDELLTTILRFRTHPIALVGDIVKMYRQVLVHPDDVPLQRIFWRFSSDMPVQTFDLLTVTYGLAPSSFLATRTLLQLADDEGRSYSIGSRALRKGFYVDDFIGGEQTVERVIRLRIELSELLEKGGFVLRKWTSNRLEVLHGLDADKIGTQSPLEFTPHETVKALGIIWEPEGDFLRFDSQVQHDGKPPTKRSILSSIAKLFDPIGLIAPVVVRAKIIMQQLWLLPVEWDDPVPETVRNNWENYHDELPKITAHRVNRYAFLPCSTIQLHTFADASELAYGACIYARCEDEQGNVKVELLAAKSRVAPLKRLTIARLELCAAVLAAHLHDRVKHAIDIDVSASIFWSDSAIVLQWLRSPPNTWQTFVGNRVSEIQQLTHGCQWRHVPGSENPADLVSRGMSVDEFLNSKLWKKGPHWLLQHCREWAAFEPPGVAEEMLEVRHVVTLVQSTPSVNAIFLRWSSYTRLLHVTGYCLRFLRNAHAKARTQPPPNTTSVVKSLSVELLTQAKFILIRLAQQDAFGSEIRELEKGKPVAKHSHVRQMSPFLDQGKVLRVGGRLKLAQLPYQMKHPALLPSFHPLSLLIANYYHNKMLHAGGRVLLSVIREEFWPVHGRRLVRSTVRKCFRCTRLNPEPARQHIGQLPVHRIVPSRPFSVAGVDYAGPLYLKPIHKRAAPAKAYICLFICFATKAVHIELVSDLTTQAFLCALRRFIARRGRPTHIHSDNGKNFEGAKNELQQLFAMFQNQEEIEKITSTCAEEGITWHLVPPKAPHFGGLWEAAIKVAKKQLYRQLGPSRLSFEDVGTVLSQIEALMNSRPLLPMSDDPDDLAALTPAHFLIGTSMLALPDPDHRNLPVNRLDHYQKLQLHVQKFWCHWRSEYLQELQKDTVMNRRNDSMLPGRMVVVVDEMQQPIRWPLARILTTSPGPDGMTRVVTLRTVRGIITRPITKVCLLPDSTTTAIDGEEDPLAINPQPAQRSGVLEEEN